MSKRIKPTERAMLAVVMGLLGIQQSESASEEDRNRASKAIDIINWCLGCPSSFQNVADLCIRKQDLLAKISDEEWDGWMEKYADACASDSQMEGTVTE